MVEEDSTKKKKERKKERKKKERKKEKKERKKEEKNSKNERLFLRIIPPRKIVEKKDLELKEIKNNNYWEGCRMKNEMYNKEEREWKKKKKKKDIK